MPQGELVIKRTFSNVSADKVFDAWTDPQTMAKWYGPEGMVTTIHEFDLQEGGTYRLTMQAPDGSKFPLRGSFREIRRPERLVFSWQWENAAETSGPGAQETLVTIDIRAKGADVALTLTHNGFLTPEAAASHNDGWTSMMVKLTSLLAA